MPYLIVYHSQHRRVDGDPPHQHPQLAHLLSQQPALHLHHHPLHPPPPRLPYHHRHLDLPLLQTHPQLRFMVYYKKKEERIREEDPDGNYGASQKSDSQQSEYSVTTESKHKEFNRNQSRFLEFVSLSVVLAINVNAFASNILEIVTFGLAAVLYFMFNVLRKWEDKEGLRLLFFIPLIGAYLPFYIESKSLVVS